MREARGTAGCLDFAVSADPIDADEPQATGLLLDEQPVYRNIPIFCAARDRAMKASEL